MSSIQDALDTLESQIGVKSGSGFAFDVTSLNKKQVISWLTIKGIQDPNLKSNLVLGKLYGIPAYYNSVLKNQHLNQHKYSRNVSNLDFETSSSEEVNIREWINPLLEEEISNIDPETLIQRSSRQIIHQTITNELEKNRISLKNDQLKLNEDLFNKITESVKEQLNANNQATRSIATDIAEKITESKIKTEIDYQTNELKKLIEDIIFKSYLNQRINTPQNNTETEINSESILELNLNNPHIPQIDSNYHFDPYATKVIRSALSMQENLYVYGDTGCGKTTHLEQVCAVMNHGLIRINPHDGITREMFLGSMKLINNETIFVPGALPLAMKNGYVFLVDEISFLPPNLTAILNPIGEKNGKLYIPETSEWISPAPGFCIFATDNTGGKGDRTGNYTGIEVQNTATLDRFAFCLKMDYLPQEKECEMLLKRFPNQNPQEIANMNNLAKDIRSAFSRGELSITLSTRKLIKFFDQRENNFDIQEALSNTILSWLDEDDENLVKTMIDRLDLYSETS